MAARSVRQDGVRTSLPAHGLNEGLTLPEAVVDGLERVAALHHVAPPRGR
jgi:hypothetical protein